ncbi:substrate-binding domain-containing protein [Neotabrizicola shimadae]|uniref:Substrate-binding domain-containing protein n=1 Tax=Neotabrizicola shimadae TaxID=2807096 RepID=A0A8G0ZXL3_9RHOB|nr:substrate-binding domain-containing protein [Neotabrizicola shimadae]QYZ72108.1 substrate-binding domain-containing protein [Neotabrizicola shimadae]
MKLKTILKATATAVLIAASAPAAMAAEIAVIGGMNSDQFWNKIKKGVDDARLVVEANGGKVDYLRMQSYDNFAADAADIIRVAISQNPDGIAVPNWVYESQDPAIKEAIAAGIKVILFNAGTIEKADELGAINYVGSDEYIAGRAGGEQLAKLGAKKGVCINTLPGTANIEARCKGMIDAMTEAGATAEQLPLPSTAFGDPAAIAEAVKAYLSQNPDVTGALAIGAGEADAAAIGIQQAGLTGKVSLGCFDFNEATLNRIKAGEQAFAIDQQPYLQALLAVTLLASHIDFGTDLPTAPLLTGPGIIDASNVDATIAGVQLGAR